MPTVAPKAEPDEIPSIYGSAMGFLNIAWKEQPTMDRPIPIIIDINILGKRIFKTIRLSEALILEVSIKIFIKGSLENKIFIDLKKFISAAPSAAQNIISKNKITVRIINNIL